MSKDERGWLSVFLYLQALDVLSTLIGFSLGNTEASPFIRLMIRWGPVTGLALSKAVAIGLVAVCFAIKRTRLIRLINFWYAAVVIWNLYTVLAVLITAEHPIRAAEPGEVIQKVTAALRHNDSPIPNAGIFTTFQFASPGNLAVTGPYGRFLQLAKSADFAPMLHDNPQELGELVVRGDHAEQILRVRSEDGHGAVYKFDVTRQTGGGWTVDGVSLLKRE
jgi:hypothetical protein